MTDYQYGENPLDRIMTERRFTAAVAAMSALLSNQHVTKFYAHTDDAMKSIASDAIEATDALLAALEEKK